MQVAAWIILAAVLALVLAVLIRAGIAYLLRRLRTVGERRLSERYDHAAVVLSDGGALFFGLSSRGLRQIRGTGVLVLTDDELWFSRYLLREDLQIPLSHVREVRLVGSHLRKRIIGRHLLFVRFAPGDNNDDREDSIAWLVTDPNSWKAEISRRLGRPSGLTARPVNQEDAAEPATAAPDKNRSPKMTSR